MKYTKYIHELFLGNNGNTRYTKIFNFPNSGLNHRPSSGVKWKLNELRGTFTLESQINTEYEMN